MLFSFLACLVKYQTDNFCQFTQTRFAGLLLRHLQNQFPKILAIKKLEQRLRKRVQPNHHIFLRLHLPITQIASHFGDGDAVAVGVVEDDDAFHAGSVDEQREVVFWALNGGRIVVLADGAADDDAGFFVDAGEHGVENFAADVVEVDVDAVRAVFLDRKSVV